jgi:hypothetical protein
LKVKGWITDYKSLLSRLNFDKVYKCKLNKLVTNFFAKIDLNFNY